MAWLARHLGCLVAAITLTGCPPPLEYPEGQSRCPQACDRWKHMGCEEGFDTCDRYHEPEMVCAVWIPCESWCSQVESKLNLECVVSVEADSCSDLETACTQ